MANKSRNKDHSYLDSLKEQYYGCARCEAIVPYITQQVWGSGPTDTMVMVVGEAPGGEEDIDGEPFKGPAGQTLNNLFEEAELERSDLYITNSIICRPTTSGKGVGRKNRTPSPAEVNNCKNRLISEILYVDPLVILALGGTPANALLGKRKSLESIRGEAIDIVIRTIRGIEVKYPMIATYHPSYLMTYAKQNELYLAIKDMQLLKDLVMEYIEQRGKE